MTSSSLVEKIKSVAIGLTLVSIGISPFYHGCYRLALIKREQKELLEQMPKLVVVLKRQTHCSSETVYGFNTDNDPEIDRIVKTHQGFGPGPRSGTYFYKTVITEKDPNFEEEVKHYSEIK